MERLKCKQKHYLISIPLQRRQNFVLLPLYNNVNQPEHVLYWNRDFLPIIAVSTSEFSASF